MRLLLDFHIAKTISVALLAEGHDVVRAAIDHPTWTDRDLLALAVREQRTIITQDGDFTDLIFAASATPPPSLIYLRCEPQDQRNLVERVLMVVADEQLDNHIVVITPFNTRYRRLPQVDNDNG